MKRFLLCLALVLLPVVLHAQAASLPYQMIWGEQVNGGQVYQNDKHICDRLERVFVDAAQYSITLGTSAEEVASLPTEITDKGGNFNASGTFTAPFTGYYRVSIQGDFEGNTNGIRRVRAMVASSTWHCSETACATGTVAVTVAAAQTVKMTSGQILEVHAYQTSGSTLLATLTWQIEGLPW